eukprot:997654-Rhodomonas_salina.1
MLSAMFPTVPPVLLTSTPFIRKAPAPTTFFPHNTNQVVLAPASLMPVQPVPGRPLQDPLVHPARVACGGAYGELRRDAPRGEVDPVGRRAVE